MVKKLVAKKAVVKASPKSEVSKKAVTKRVFKTKKTLSGTKSEFRAWKEWSEGDYVIGQLIGTNQNKKNKSKKDWIIKVEDAEFEDSKLARELVGKNLTLNTAGQLDKGMDQVEIGDLVKVMYNGSAEMQGGDYKGEMAHNMEVSLVEEESDDSEDDEDLDEEEEEYEDDDSEEEEIDEEDEEDSEDDL
jgi:hypothetical protein